MASPVYADIGPTATLTDLFISLAVVVGSGISTCYCYTSGWFSHWSTAFDRWHICIGYRQTRCDVSSSKMRDELAPDNFIFSIIKQTLLHYHHYFVTLSSRLGYNLDKTLLHYRKDFVTHFITIIKFVLHTFQDKFSALTHHTTNYIYLVLYL